MKKFFLKMTATVGLALGLTLGAHAAGADTIAWDKAPDRSNDLAALQHGAKLFANYCLNCHAAAHVRYNRLKDIGLTEAQIKDNLLFASDKVGETMKIAMDPKLGKDWFGGNPPDLSLVARSRSVLGKGSGADYLYTYLRSYYRDGTKETGWNNLVFPNVAMPHALWELQGERRPVMEQRQVHGHATPVFKGWEQVSPGQLAPLQYDEAVGDLVGYLQWMAEPSRNRSVQVGFWVVLFLGVFVVIAWRLNAAYWKHVK
jgi:ubiquinol-cytochrome c reductase cytochrome c1 subunit